MDRAICITAEAENIISQEIENMILNVVGNGYFLRVFLNLNHSKFEYIESYLLLEDSFLIYFDKIRQIKIGLN